MSNHLGPPAGAEASTVGTVATGGIALRPEIDPEVMAVLVAALDQAWPRARPARVEKPTKPPVWRFSGRWWSRPAPTRRIRPWA